MGERQVGPKDFFRGWCGPKRPKRWIGTTGNQLHRIARARRRLVEQAKRAAALRAAGFLPEAEQLERKVQETTPAVGLSAASS